MEGPETYTFSLLNNVYSYMTKYNHTYVLIRIGKANQESTFFFLL